MHPVVFLIWLSQWSWAVAPRGCGVASVLVYLGCSSPIFRAPTYPVGTIHDQGPCSRSFGHPKAGYRPVEASHIQKAVPSFSRWWQGLALGRRNTHSFKVIRLG